jgi:hypothetical protein
MVSAGLTPILGHARVLDEGLTDARRRVLAYEGDSVVGVGVFEPLFGPHAEGVIAVREGASGTLLPYLLDELLERVNDAGLVAVRFVFGTREQHPVAERLSQLRSHCALRPDWLDIRLEPEPAPSEATA